MRIIVLHMTRNGRTQTFRFFDPHVAVKQARTLLDFGCDVCIEDADGARFAPSDFDQLLSIPIERDEPSPAFAEANRSIDQIVQVLSEILQDVKRNGRVSGKS